MNSTGLDLSDESWMLHALELARKSSSLGEVPVGAVLVMDGKAIGEGWNQPISSRDPTAHAEIIALRQGARLLDNYRMPGSVLYVTLEPCTMCAGAMVHARVARLVFGAREARSGAVVSQAQVLANKALNHRIDIDEGVMAKECGDLLTGFFQSRR